VHIWKKIYLHEWQPLMIVFEASRPNFMGIFFAD